MSISPSATALCSRRSVPLRSASEMRITYSPLMSVIAATNGTAAQSAPKLTSTGLPQIIGRQLIEHAPEHSHRVLRRAATDDQRRERHIAAVAREPRV